MINRLKGTFAMFYKYRFLLQNLIQRDIKVKYRRSTLGILWSVLNPLLMMLVMTLVFSHFFRFDIENYPVYLLRPNIEHTIKQIDLIREFLDAQKHLDSEYFVYNEKYQRFECTVNVLFAEEDDKIPAASKTDLINAGKELEGIIEKFNKSVNVAFKVVIEGRAARHLNYPTKLENDQADAKGWKYAETLSYNRARSLYALWQENGILKDIEKINGEVFISGSGFGGQGRYSGYGPNGEDKNKTFIIQIIPYIKHI